MSLGRTACAVVVTIALAVGATGSNVAVAAGDHGKPSWRQKDDGYQRSPKADRISADRVGDADRDVDILSLAVFNRKKLDFVGVAIGGRDFGRSTARTVQVYVGVGRNADTPRYRIVAANDGRRKDVRKPRLYRVAGWSTDGEKRVRCERLRVQFDTAHQSQIRIAVPRSCIRRSRKGVSANATVRDAAPSPRDHGRPRGERTAGAAGGERADVVPADKVLTRAAG